MPAALRLGLFSPSVVLGVAAVTGRLDRAGIAVGTVPATSSAEQFAALDSGDLDAALTSPDNVLAYRGSAANPLGRTLDIRILAAIDRGLGLSLFTGPDVDPDDLAGGVLAVDVPTSGFAFVAYELLARHGLSSGDYEVRKFGSTPRRARALLAGECAMTVLNAGNDLYAEARGCRRLSRAASLGPYLGTVLAASGTSILAASGTATAHSPGPLAALTGVLVETAGELAVGRLQTEGATAAADLLGLDEPGVRRYLDTLADPAEGLVPGGRPDEASMVTLRWLRTRYGQPGTDPAAGELLDHRFLPRAAP